MELGSSLAVGNVQELASKNMEVIPERFVRPDIELEEISVDESLCIPVIDMTKLASCDQLGHLNEMEKLHQACQEWGFFQLINHGSASAIEKMKVVAGEFFKQPLEVKMANAIKPNGLEGYGQHFVVSSDQKLDWCDLLFYRILPLNTRNIQVWPNSPSSFRSTLLEYSAELNKISLSLLKLMAVNLGLHSDTLSSTYQDGTQNIRMNYYPPCPWVDKVIGISPHSDASALTLLVQANEVEGLQIKKNGKWVPVKPVPGAIIINIGDVMEMMTNGAYKSIEHRAVVNSEKERLSIAAFHAPSTSSRIGPLQDLVDNQENYKTVDYEDFLQMYFESKLDGKSLLSRIKINHAKD